MTKLRQYLVFILVSIGSLYSFKFTHCLHEDQIGKFDWRQQFIGIPKYVYYESGADNIIFGTESNVISSIHISDGSIQWRRLLPNNCDLKHLSALRLSDSHNEYLIRTTCNDTSGQSETQHWVPFDGLLASSQVYNEFIADQNAESVPSNQGNIHADSTIFNIDKDIQIEVSKCGLLKLKIEGLIKWQREEALASVDSVEITRLPLDMRDKFGLKKMIVLYTEGGKLFGLDTFTGSIEWKSFDERLSTKGFKFNGQLITLRQSTDDDPRARLAAVNPNGFIVQFDPINGKTIDTVELHKPIKQLAFTETSSHDNTRGVIILDSSNNVHIYPKTMTPLVKSGLYKYSMIIAEARPASVEGYRFILDKSGQILPKQTWTLAINETEVIVNFGLKRIDEEVHSPARVLGDRGILYKYVNPNLIAIMTQGTSGSTCAPNQFINLYLVDGVTGSLVHMIHHPKALTREPANLVHSENWLIYTYYNIKTRRTEVSSIEMYEGVEQENSTFSSLTRRFIKPKIIEHKSFIFPGGIDTMVDSVTLRGMTNKHLIAALPSGYLLEIPRIFLDPRRAVGVVEEGVIPYMPELPIPSESKINYFKTLIKVKAIVTSPAELESTSLLFAYGLDLFFTRITPSKTFDILKDDFDHTLIAGVLVFLVIASLVTKYLAQQKALRASWK